MRCCKSVDRGIQDEQTNRLHDQGNREQVHMIYLLPLVLIGIVGVVDVLFFSGQIGVRFSKVIGR